MSSLNNIAPMYTVMLPTRRRRKAAASAAMRIAAIASPSPPPPAPRTSQSPSISTPTTTMSSLDSIAPISTASRPTRLTKTILNGPRSAFTIFLRRVQPLLRRYRNPKIPWRIIAELISKRWNKMPAEARAPFEEQSKEEQSRFEQFRRSAAELAVPSLYQLVAPDSLESISTANRRARGRANEKRLLDFRRELDEQIGEFQMLDRRLHDRLSDGALATFRQVIDQQHALLKRLSAQYDASAMDDYVADRVPPSELVSFGELLQNEAGNGMEDADFDELSLYDCNLSDLPVIHLADTCGKTPGVKDFDTALEVFWKKVAKSLTMPPPDEIIQFAAAAGEQRSPSPAANSPAPLEFVFDSLPDADADDSTPISVETDRATTPSSVDRTALSANRAAKKRQRFEDGDDTDCALCEEQFNCEFDLDQHYLLRHSEAPFKCPECALTHNAPSALVKHYNNMHECRRVCCSIIFDNEETYNDHRSAQHPDFRLRPFVCNHCRSSFRAMLALVDHERRHIIAGDAPKRQRRNNNSDDAEQHHVIDPECYRTDCADCGRSCPNHRRLMWHRREQALSCPYCAQPFSIRCLLRKHLHVCAKRKQRHRCPDCNKLFNKRAALSEHWKQKHSDERPFECTECGKKMATERKLSEHEKRVHFDERVAKCQLCDAAFTTDARLKRHMLLHTGEKPHQCGDCGERFFYKHRLLHHDKMNRCPAKTVPPATTL